MISINIKSIIDSWDPIDLLPFAPEDEYDSESIIIEKFVMSQKDNLTSQVLGEKIKEIFVTKFGSDVFKKDLSECRIIAKKILDEIEI